MDATDLFRHPLATPEWELVQASPVRLASRAWWPVNLPDETSAPAHRVIHSRAVFAAQPVVVDRLHIGRAAGYHKCASGQEVDAALRVRLRTPTPTGWEVVKDVHAGRDEVLHGGLDVDLGGLATTALVAEVREAATDRWWPGWNLVNTGLQLHGRTTAPWSPPPQHSLTLDRLDLSGLPAGVTVTHRNSEIRFQTPFLEVGFRLFSPAWSYLSLDADGSGRTGRNLLQLPRSMDIVRSGVYPSGVYPVLRDQNAEYLAQGPRLSTTHGHHPMGFLASEYTGSTEVIGNEVTYRVDIPSAGQRYVLRFVVERDRVLLHAARDGDRETRAWTSSAWHVATDNRVTPSCALGRPSRRGEAGLLDGPVLWHFPRYASLAVSTQGDGQWRSDSVRPLDTNTFELKIGEIATEDGDYLLPAGHHECTVDLVVSPGVDAGLNPDSPAAVRRMVSRHTATALAFRADTATYSNNGASMHCTTSLGEMSAIAERCSPVLASISPMDWVGMSLERWLDGAPSYGSGATSHGSHRLEDEYVHMAANTLTALGRFLTHGASDDWYDRHRSRILLEVEQMLDRDVDGDGLIESTLRRGVAGEHQWSTAWADVISFGYKDAWANAALFDAWTLLVPVLQARGETKLAQRVRDAAYQLQKAYAPTFVNPATGLVAGWRSVDGVLHDHGFPLVNGAACASELLPQDQARGIMERLVQAWTDAGVRDLRNGLPLNLWRIPEDEIGGVIFGLPMGGYQQGGMSHHGARVVVDALHRVGMTQIADELLTALAETIADDSSFGGLGSGLDWRMWDGTPSGYEGQLIEGFSVLASALRRYGIETR